MWRLFLLINIDRFTKWVEIIPLSDSKAETVAFAFHANWICWFGVPREVITDQGRQLEGVLYQDSSKQMQ